LGSGCSSLLCGECGTSGDGTGWADVKFRSPVAMLPTKQTIEYSLGFTCVCVCVRNNDMQLWHRTIHVPEKLKSVILIKFPIVCIEMQDCIWQHELHVREWWSLV
jgi:hypothetical protein